MDPKMEAGYDSYCCPNLGIRSNLCAETCPMCGEAPHNPVKEGKELQGDPEQ